MNIILDERDRRETERATCDCRWGWTGTERILKQGAKLTEADVFVHLEFCERVGDQPLVTRCKRTGCEWRDA